MFIVRPDIEEADLDKLVEGFSAVITTGNGEVKQVEKLGRRRLAYIVRKFQDGSVHPLAHQRRRSSLSPSSSVAFALPSR